MTGAARKDTRWYGRRRGKKLRPGRQALLDTLLPEIKLCPPSDGGSDWLAESFSPPPADIWLEIGFGAGEHLYAQACAHSDVGFIGCEPFVNGVASLLAQIDAGGASNIRIFDDDVRLVLDALPDASIGRLFVLFSDPWPKRRHQRRRLISTESLDQFARLLRDGAEFRFASDHMEFVRWTLERTVHHPAFSWPALGRSDWSRAPDDWVQTRYEAKALEHGRHPVYLRFLRRSRNEARGD